MNLNLGNILQCQSCGLPLKEASHFGTNLDGGRTQDFCIMCFEDGSFVEPDITKEQMIEKVFNLVCERSKAHKAHLRIAIEFMFESLKRWQ